MRDSARLRPVANQLYRRIFQDLGMPLENGETSCLCTKEEFQAGYDYALGIDVILHFEGGFTATMQEKFLFTEYNTITVEYYQDPRFGQKGDWFNMRCQYYFVGYDFPKTGQRFTTWALLDWPRTQIATAQGRIHWLEKPNRNDGARANFRYTPIRDLPTDVVISASVNLGQQRLFV